MVKGEAGHCIEGSRMKFLSSTSGMILVALVVTVVAHISCVYLFNVNASDAKIVTLFILLVYFSWILGARKLIEAYKRKGAARWVFSIFVLLFSGLEAFCFKTNIIPLPQTGEAALDFIYAFIFGGVAIYASTLVMRLIEPKK
jgi:TRAP-type C4-dicarboxylate transport system permease small subunit